MGAKSKARQNRIVEILEESRYKTVAELAQLTGLSDITIRRDLSVLEREHRIIKVHGGARCVDHSADVDLYQRSLDRQEVKKRIAAFAASLVDSGDTIFLGGGSTILALCPFLLQKDITIITNSLAVVKAFENEDLKLICIGGEFHKAEQTFTGPFAQQALQHIRVNKAFISAEAIDLEQGVTSSMVVETETDREIMKVSKNIHLLMG